VRMAGLTAQVRPAANAINLLVDAWRGGEPRLAEVLAMPGVVLHLRQGRAACGAIWGTRRWWPTRRPRRWRV
jgi:hypothetical protein